MVSEKNKFFPIIKLWELYVVMATRVHSNKPKKLLEPFIIPDDALYHD